MVWKQNARILYSRGGFGARGRKIRKIKKKLRLSVGTDLKSAAVGGHRLASAVWPVTLDIAATMFAHLGLVVFVHSSRWFHSNNELAVNLSKNK